MIYFVWEIFNQTWDQQTMLEKKKKKKRMSSFK